MIYLLILVPIVFFSVLYFGNKRISNRFEKLHQDFLIEIKKHNHSRFENIKAKCNAKGLIGFKYKVAYYDVTFTENNIFFEQNLKNSRKKIVHYQPVSQYTFKNSDMLKGVYFIQNVRDVIKERNLLTLKYTRTDTLVPAKCSVQLDFSDLNTDIGNIINRYKIPFKRR